MIISLGKKLAISFLLAIIMSILTVGIISNRMIDKRFDEYLQSEHRDRINKIVGLIGDMYNTQNGQIISEEISRYAMMENLYIEVKDDKGNVIYRSGKDYLLHKGMMNGMMKNMMRRHGNINPGKYIEEKFPLNKDGKQSGTIIVGYFGSFNVSEQDLGFKDTLNRALIISTSAALLFGLIISFILSKQLSNPLVKITKIADEMRDGNLEIRSDIKSSTLEINHLSSSMNYLAETLSNQEMLRKRMTSDMAHEIRTPLTTLQTYLEAMMDGIWEPTFERLQSCYEEIQRITKLTDDLRNLAKLEQSTLGLYKSRFDLSSDLERIIDSFKPLFKKKNIALKGYISQGIEINMDRDKLKQIMHNLLSNAYKYTGENGTVEVLLTRENKWAIIKVKDNGIGISEKDIPFIFERFYRGDVSRNRETGGAGIGLAITKNLVSAHGGKIEVESQEGKGSVFTVKLPL